jgi:hypothetical protein
MIIYIIHVGYAVTKSDLVFNFFTMICCNSEQSCSSGIYFYSSGQEILYFVLVINQSVHYLDKFYYSKMRHFRIIKSLVGVYRREQHVRYCYEHTTSVTCFGLH